MVVEDFSPGDYDPPTSMQVIKAPVVGKAPSRINPFRSIRFPCKREQKEETLWWSTWIPPFQNTP